MNAMIRVKRKVQDLESMYHVHVSFVHLSESKRKH